MPTDTGLEDLDLEQADIEEKIEELSKMEKRTSDQDAELIKLRGDKKKLLTTRIQHKHSEMLAEKNKREIAEKRAAELQKQLDERNENNTRVTVGNGNIKPSITIDGQKFYTNQELDALVKSGEMTQAEAQDAYDDRQAAKAASINSQKNQKQNEMQIRNEDMKKVLDEHPEFNPQHPDHNPDDPLFKEADRIYRNGYSSNWKGLSLALDEAKRILGVKASSRPDRTSDLEITSSTSPADKTTGKKVELTDKEAEWAIQYYCYGSIKNSETGKAYTRQEALAKALKIKVKKIKGGV